MWDWDVGQFLNERRQIDAFWSLAERIAAVEVDMLPSDRRDLLKCDSALHLAEAFFVCQEMGQASGVVRNDAVGEQTAASPPEVLFTFGFEAWFAEVGLGHCAV